MVLFYKPYNLRRMKKFFNRKNFAQENEVLPNHLKMSIEEVNRGKFLKKKISEGPANSVVILSDLEKKKMLLAKAMKKNTDENLEFIDEVKMNVIQNTFLKRKLNKSQMKLLPLAYVNKISKDVENGKFENEKNIDILEIYERFKAKKLDYFACEGMKKVRKFILEGMELLKDGMENTNKDD